MRRRASLHPGLCEPFYFVLANEPCGVDHLKDAWRDPEHRLTRIFEESDETIRKPSLASYVACQWGCLRNRLFSQLVESLQLDCANHVAEIGEMRLLGFGKWISEMH